VFSSQNLPLKLADHTLALTYDDGPGPASVEIAKFLRDQGIRATFFVVGQQVRTQRDIVRKVRELGHLIGNHTNTHRPLPSLLVAPDELISEVVDADHLIEEFVGDGPFLLRAPGGSWSQEVAEVLNRNAGLHKYMGPIIWEIQHSDYEIGSPRHLCPGNELYTLQACQENYRQDILAKKSGVILMHDWSADAGELGDQLRRNNRTLELTQWLVPRLVDFKFVALDEVGIRGL